MDEGRVGALEPKWIIQSKDGDCGVVGFERGLQAMNDIRRLG